VVGSYRPAVFACGGVFFGVYAGRRRRHRHSGVCCGARRQATDIRTTVAATDGRAVMGIFRDGVQQQLSTCLGAFGGANCSICLAIVSTSVRRSVRRRDRVPATTRTEHEDERSTRLREPSGGGVVRVQRAFARFPHHLTPSTRRPVASPPSHHVPHHYYYYYYYY